MSSWYQELPPSMTVSPEARSGVSWSSSRSTMAAGTISQPALGGVSRSTNPPSVPEPTHPTRGAVLPCRQRALRLPGTCAIVQAPAMVDKDRLPLGWGKDAVPLHSYVSFYYSLEQTLRQSLAFI